MKLEDLLTQPSNDKIKRPELEEEIDKLEAELDGELKLNRVLQNALEGGPTHSSPCLSPVLPLKIQVLLDDLAMVEEQIALLEGKVDKLKLNLHQEKKHNRELELQQQRDQHPRYSTKRSQKHLHSRHKNRAQVDDYELYYSNAQQSYRNTKEQRAALASSMDIQTWGTDDKTSKSKFLPRSQKHIQLDREIITEKPNKLSEDLIKCLIDIFLKLNQSLLDTNASAMVPKYIHCIDSKGLISKTTIDCTEPTFPFEDMTTDLDPYGILPDLDDAIRDIGPYKNFIQMTRNSLDSTRISECDQEVGKLRILVQKLCDVELTILTHKQKLAFWINIYNACIMHAFLQHGLPSTQEKLLELMNKAAINVGGVVLNALAIEHFILRHPSDSNLAPIDEKEMLLQLDYGLRYPEPNVTFALCRGSWSSPALRVYTSDEIVNELRRARLEYLEASVGVTSKKKIMVPKLLQWHMRDFAGDMESLIEWIYSQLPQSSSLKKLIMECLNSETKLPTSKMIKIQPYLPEFRYLLPL